MKYFVQILFYLLMYGNLNAQNLITNPSFEDIDSCYGQPAGIGFDVFDWSGCTGWSCPIASSSDLWCPHPGSGVEPPDISVLYQYPRSGSNYAGLLENGGTILNYREYIQNELLEELEKDKIYRLSFYYSSKFVDCSMNVFQVIFRKTKMSNTNLLWLTDTIPDASTNPVLYNTDTLGWHLGELIYKAKGGEKFMVFGNFQDTTMATYAQPCDTSFWGNISYAGNYFVFDDFNLEETPMSYSLPNVFTPNSDGINDIYLPSVINILDWKMEIVNRWGNSIITLSNSQNYWDGSKNSEGTYFYKFWSEENNIIEQGFISLVR